MLPRQGGLETLRELRRGGYRTPVLILTSRSSVDDRVRGLDAGADDYLVKPFALPELLARVRALLRRGNGDVPARANFRLSDLEVDVNGRKARRGSQLLDLTAKEFNLLEYFLSNQGKVVSRDMLARDVWKEISRHTPIDNVIDVQIARLRRKIDDPFPNKLLHTVRGIGFVLREEKE
jgi:DNA-binding response OmpR family regulator